MAQMSHPIKHDSLPRVPLCAHIRFAQNSFFVLRTKSSASMALTKTKTKKTKKQQPKNPGPKPIKCLFYRIIKIMTVMKLSRTNLLNCFVFCAS